MLKKILYCLTPCLMLITLLLGACTQAAPATTPAPAATPTPAPAPAAPLIIKFGSWNTVAASDLFGLCLQQWLKEVEKRTSGRVVFQPYWGSTLVPTRGELEALRTGIVQAAAAKPAYYPASIPLCDISSLGGIEDDPWVAHMAYRELMQLDAVKKELAQFNAMYMTSIGTGSNFLFSTKPIKNADDLKGMKIRGLDFAQDMIQGLGGIPVALTATEVYDALSKGIVQGCFQNWVSARTYRSPEIAKYDYMLKTGACPFFMLIRIDTWNKISPADQKIMQDYVPEYIKYFVDQYNVTGPVTAKNAICKEWGCNVIEPTAEDVAKVKKIAADSWAKWLEPKEKAGLPAKLALDTFMKACEKYRPQSPFVGQYPE